MDVNATSPPPGRGTRPALPSVAVRPEVLAAAAQKLGISVAKLRDELAAGRPLGHVTAVTSTPALPVPQPHEDWTVDVRL
jgi:hypothetical protein